MVSWSKPAQNDLKNIYTYIHPDSPVLAQRVIGTVVQKVSLLDTFPEMGKIVLEREDQLFRELLIYSYRIVYTVRAQNVFIVTIIHSKQDFSSTLIEKIDGAENNH
jgi:addiction module RelE/StbE family toxin